MGERINEYLGAIKFELKLMKCIRLILHQKRGEEEEEGGGHGTLDITFLRY